MSDDHGREVVLGRVRESLAGVAPSEKPARPPRSPDSRRSRAELVRQFVEASEAAGAHVVTVAGVDDVQPAVAAILHREGAASMAVSPEAEGYAPNEAPGQRWVLRRAGTTWSAGDIATADAGLTCASYGLADTGTVVMRSSPEHHRLDSLLPPVHIVVLMATGLLPDLRDLFGRMSIERSMARHSAVVFVTGPSRTADIELTLTIGVHGPRALYTILVAGDTPVHAAMLNRSEGGDA